MYKAAVPNSLPTGTELPPPGYTEADARCVETGPKTNSELPTPRVVGPASHSNSAPHPFPSKANALTVPRAPAPTSDAPDRLEPSRSAVGPQHTACQSDAAAQAILDIGGDDEARSPAEKPKRQKRPVPSPTQLEGQGQRNRDLHPPPTSSGTAARDSELTHR